MELSRQEYWNGWPFPSPGNLPNPGIEPRSPTLQADSLTSEPQGKPIWCINWAPRYLPKWAENVCPHKILNKNVYSKSQYVTWTFKLQTFKYVNMRPTYFRREWNCSLPSVSHCWRSCSSAVSRLLSLLQSVTLDCSLDASTCANCCAVLLYCIAGLKCLDFFHICFLCINCVKSIINLLQ